MATSMRPHRIIREHKKSRLGCFTCKKRKVKCDQGRPICGACGLRKTSCQYPENLPLAWNSPDAAEGHNAKNDTAISHRIPIFAEVDPILPESTPADMRLLWFFTAHTSKSLLAEQYDQTGFGKTVQTLVVQEALEHPFLMKTLFVIAGLHMRHLNQDIDPRAMQKYRAESLCGYRRAIENAKPATYSALLATSILIAAPSCGNFRDPSSPDLYILDWIVLWRGIKCINMLFGEDPEHHSTGIKTMLVRPILDMDDIQSFIPLRLQSMLVNIQDGDPEGAHIEAYQEALRYLGSLYKSLHQDSRASTALLTVTWITYLPESFINAARQHMPRGLVILAHYSAFFKILQNMWWAEGTAERCIHDIYARVGTGWRREMKTPLLVAASQNEGEAIELLRSELLDLSSERVVSRVDFECSDWLRVNGSRTATD